MLFNVVYNLKESPSRKHSQNPGSPNQKISVHSATVGLENEGEREQNKNSVRLNIEYSDLRKFVPRFDPNSAGDLQQVGAELSRAIIVDPQGNLSVNSSKLDPASIKLLENRFNLKKDSEPENDSRVGKHYKEMQKKKVTLLKTAKICGGHKYLFAINSMERLAPMCELQQADKDNAFEEYEIYLEIVATCLSNNNKKRLVWEVSLGEAQKLLEIDDQSKIASYIISNLEVFDDTLLLIAHKNFVTDYSKIVVINEHTLRMIQKRIRAKRFEMSHLRYKREAEELDQTKTVVVKTALRMQDIVFVVRGYEDQKGRLDIVVWDTIRYTRLECNIDQHQTKRLYKENKRKVFEIILRNLLLQKEPNGATRLIIKQKTFEEDIHSAEQLL